MKKDSRVWFIVLGGVLALALIGLSALWYSQETSDSAGNPGGNGHQEAVVSESEAADSVDDDSYVFEASDDQTNSVIFWTAGLSLVVAFLASTLALTMIWWRKALKGGQTSSPRPS